MMRKIAAAFEKSDLRPLLDAIHEDIVWKSASNEVGLFRFHGEYKARTGVLDVLSQISMDYSFDHMKPLEIIASGDVVWGHFDVGIVYQPMDRRVSPEVINMEMVIRWRLKDDKIIEHQAFFDTASVLVQQRRTE